EIEGIATGRMSNAGPTRAEEAKPGASGPSTWETEWWAASGWYRAGYRLSSFIARTLFKFRVVHRERIIESGGVILAMNHQSYLDPPLAGICCRRPIYFLARKTLLNWPILGPIFPKLNVVPVN